MKATFFFLAALIAVAAAQSETETTTEALLMAQGELSIGHEFVETLLQVNRNVISMYIELVSSMLLDSFMDTYSEIHIIQDDTTALFDALEQQNSCTDAARARWDLQIHRYGQKLSECLLGSVAEVNAWNDYVNTVHHTAQATTNQVQNAGVATLSEIDDYTDRDSLYLRINSRFRSLLLAASPYLDRYEEFRRSVVDNEEQIVADLTQCDRALAAGFAIEAREDIQRAQAC